MLAQTPTLTANLGHGLGDPSSHSQRNVVIVRAETAKALQCILKVLVQRRMLPCERQWNEPVRVADVRRFLWLGVGSRRDSSKRPTTMMTTKMMMPKQAHLQEAVFKHPSGGLQGVDGSMNPLARLQEKKPDRAIVRCVGSRSFLSWAARAP